MSNRRPLKIGYKRLPSHGISLSKHYRSGNSKKLKSEAREVRGYTSNPAVVSPHGPGEKIEKSLNIFSTEFTNIRSIHPGR